MPDFGIQPTIFASNAEIKLFHALRSRWEPQFQIFAQLPLANVLGPPPSTATAAEKEFHWKTSVDYTLCDQQYRPLLSIEFDGMGHGFSRDGKYVPMRAVPGRKRKLDYKLRIAREAAFPFFVVSYEHTTPIEAGESLTMLDGIIGYVLAKAKGHELAQKAVDDHQTEIDALGHEANDYISDLVIEAGYIAELEHDVFEDAIARMKYDLANAGQPDQVECEHFTIPPTPPVKSTGSGLLDLDLPSLKSRIAAFENADVHGTKAVLRLKDAPIVVRNVALRSVGDWSMASALSEQIAKYLVLRHATKLSKLGNPA